MRRYGSLININPSGKEEKGGGFCIGVEAIKNRANC